MLEKAFDIHSYDRIPLYREYCRLRGHLNEYGLDVLEPIPELESQILGISHLEDEVSHLHRVYALLTGACGIEDDDTH